MSDLVVALDLTQPAGSQFGPEVISEIQRVAPSTLADGGVTEVKLADGAVTVDKLGSGAVTSTKIASGGVETANVADGAITGAKMAADTITPTQTGPGVMTCTDKDNNNISLRAVTISSADYAAIATPDPNTAYFIT